MREHNVGLIWVRLVAVAALATIASGCNGTDSSNGTQAANDVASGSVDTSLPVDSAVLPAGKDSLTISGSPAAMVLTGNSYSFQPTVKSVAGAHVTFTIANKPAWAAFSTTTGALTGQPSAADAGQYAQIVITASDGVSAATLPAFWVTVADSAPSSVTVSWMPPSTNSDGSTITNLAGYQISYGRNAGALTQKVKLNGVGLTSYVIDNLTPGLWYFSIQAFNSSGVASAATPVIAADIGQSVNYLALH